MSSCRKGETGEREAGHGMFSCLCDPRGVGLVSAREDLIEACERQRGLLVERKAKQLM
jgi:hypothetical protein